MMRRSVSSIAVPYATAAAGACAASYAASKARRSILSKTPPRSTSKSAALMAAGNHCAAAAESFSAKKMKMLLFAPCAMMLFQSSRDGASAAPGAGGRLPAPFSMTEAAAAAAYATGSSSCSQRLVGLPNFTWTQHRQFSHKSSSSSTSSEQEGRGKGHAAFTTRGVFIPLKKSFWLCAALLMAFHAVFLYQLRKAIEKTDINHLHTLANNYPRTFWWYGRYASCLAVIASETTDCLMLTSVIELGADATASTLQRCLGLSSPLVAAVDNEKDAAVRCLVKFANANSPNVQLSGKEKNIALRKSLSSNCLGYILRLDGLNVNERDWFGCTLLLHFAQSWAHPVHSLCYDGPKIVKLLADAGADINASHPRTGDNALMLIVRARDNQTYDGGLFFNKTVPVDCFYSYQYETIKALVACGIDLKMKNKNGLTARNMTVGNYRIQNFTIKALDEQK